MLVKFYWMTWAIAAMAALPLLVSGYFTGWMIILFGFIGFGLVFMGMIGVLPSMVSHPAPAKPVVSTPVLIPRESAQVRSESFGVLKSA